MPSKTGTRVSLPVPQGEMTYSGRAYRWNTTAERIAALIKSNTDLTNIVAGVIPAKTIEKIVIKEVEAKGGPHPDLIEKEESVLIAEVLQIYEHRLHDETREDYVSNGGANWRENHSKAQVTLNLRKKLGLPEHVFATECCVPVVEEPDLAALAITAHGLNAGGAEEGAA